MTPTSTAYDLVGQAWRMTQPDSTYLTNRFDLMGQVTNTSGSRTYPVGYTFDYAGRKATMTTWTNYASALGAATTTWNYDSQRGWLNNKRYTDSTGPDYTYTGAGRLLTRAWARQVSPGTRLTTTYGYGNGGDLATVMYNGGTTPGLTNTLDRLGRVVIVLQGGLTSSLSYNDAGQQVSESYAGGPLSGLTVTNRYDTFLRRTNLSLLYPPSTLQTINFGYDSASRLQVVSDRTNSAAYYYLANSPLADRVLFTNNGVFRMARTNRYDYLKRLLAVTNRPAGGSPIASVYGYNAASQRTALTNADSTYWSFGYDYLGQVTNGWKYTNSTPIADHEFAYLFDDIGNRKQTVTNGTAVSYAANLLNQYTSVGGRGWTNDPDGNLLTDSAWTNTWDGENRLLTMTTNGQKLAFTYDWQGRRIQKRVWNNTGGTGAPAVDQRFVYNGWNLIAALSSPSNVLQSFTWGSDLSASMQGAGGVGGLLAISCRGTQATNCFAAYGGNGNIVALVNCADASIAAQYEFGPFGELLRATGPMAKANPFRFSTKYQDDETDLIMYPYQPYSASTGRWLSRDPMEELGGPNLYEFVANDPVQYFDPFGDKLIDKGKVGSDVINSEWLGSKGGKGGTTEFNLVRNVPPEYEGNACGKCWTKGDTGIYDVELFYYGTLQGFQGTVTTTVENRGRGKKVTVTKGQYYFTSAAVAGIDKHELGHMAINRQLYAEFIQPAEDAAAKYRKATPLVYGKTDTECIEHLKTLINWKSATDDWRPEYTKRHAAYHNSPSSVFILNAGYIAWSGGKGVEYATGNYINGNGR